MKTHLVFLRIVFGAVALFSGRAALASDDLRIGVVVEVTDAGKKIERPAPDKPAYYEPLVLGYREMGGVVTNYQRPPPPASDVERALVQALAAQDYLVAPSQTPASLLLVFRWGIVDGEMKPIFDAKDQAIDKIDPVNDDELLALVVGQSWYELYPSGNPNARELVANLHDKNASRYFLIISALDARDFANHKQTLLWRAHVTTQYWEHYIDEVLGTMITASAPLLGTQTTEVHIITAPASPLIFSK
jgi:hypothetical protein